MTFKTDENRREFLKALPALLLTCLACQGCDSMRAEKRTPPKLNLGPLKTFGGPFTVLSVQRIAVFRDSAGLAALSLVCTHQSCLLSVNHLGSETAFNCSCHGAAFDGLGRVKNGPATVDLPWFELSIDGAGNLIADTARHVPIDWRLKQPLGL